VPTAKVISPHSGGHCECGSIIIARRAKAQSKAQPWPGRLGNARLAGLFYCIQVYACRLGPHHVFGQG
jgi:hypothetical protein